MIIRLDGQQYYVDEDKFINYCKGKVEEGLDRKIIIPNGPTIDLRSRGLLATTLRQAVTLILPLITWAAEKVGTKLPDRQRHENIILYVTNAYFQVLKETIQDAQIDLISIHYVDDMRTIDSFDINREEAGFPLLLTGNSVTTED